MEGGLVKAGGGDVQKVYEGPRAPPPPLIIFYQMSGGHPSGPLLLLRLCDSL